MTSTPSVSTATGAEPRTFVDTNVLVYARDASEPAKQQLARAALESLWESGTGVISTQVLQEFYAVATGRLRTPLSPAEAREVVERYSAWPVVTIEPLLIKAASHIHERHRISFWDALIVQAAVVAGADTLLTEDLRAGQSIQGVRVVDPFASSPVDGR